MPQLLQCWLFYFFGTGEECVTFLKGFACIAATISAPRQTDARSAAPCRVGQNFRHRTPPNGLENFWALVRTGPTGSDCGTGT
jgi:hypothetical protein